MEVFEYRVSEKFECDLPFVVVGSSIITAEGYPPRSHKVDRTNDECCDRSIIFRLKLGSE